MTRRQEIEFDRTSPEELRTLAGTLLADPDIGPSLRRIGIHGDLSPPEEQLLSTRISDFARQHNWRDRDPALLSLAIVLARWVAAGEFPSVGTDEAKAFLNDKYFQRSTSRQGIRTRKARPQEVLWVARDLKNNSLFWNAIREAGEAGEIDPKYWREVLKPIKDRIIWKYGLINRGPFDATSVLRQIASGKIYDLADPAAKRYIEQSKLFVVGKGGSNG